MIPYGRHNIDKIDVNAVVEVLQGDWLTCGPVVEKFEDKLKQVVSAQHAIACSNGTTALHLAMLALDIKAGDAVLVPAITFLASANSARYVGADVVFVDIDSATGLMTSDTLEQAISANKHRNLRAVVNVHLAGQCENLQEIYNVAKKNGLLIIEDAAHAIGTVYIDSDGVKYPIGSNAFADVTTFSFHPVKTIAMGEGGAITTNNPEIAKKLKLFRSHGMIRNSTDWQGSEVGPWYYEMQDLGYNYRVSDINCALALSQLEKLEDFKVKRAKICANYDNSFVTSEVTPIRKLRYSDTAWHLYVVLIDYVKSGKTRAQMMDNLKHEGVGTQVHYIPLYKQPYYQKLYGKISLPGCEDYYSKCLSLPLYVGLSENLQDKVIESFKRC